MTCQSRVTISPKTLPRPQLSCNCEKLLYAISIHGCSTLCLTKQTYLRPEVVATCIQSSFQRTWLKWQTLNTAPNHTHPLGWTSAIMFNCLLSHLSDSICDNTGVSGDKLDVNHPTDPSWTVQQVRPLHQHLECCRLESHSRKLVIFSLQAHKQKCKQLLNYTAGRPNQY